MKSIKLFLVVGLAAVMLFASCRNPVTSDPSSDQDVTVAIDSLSFSQSSVNVEVDDTVNLAALLTVSPNDATEDVVWESGDTNVATVSNSGVATAVALGSATIVAANADGTVTASITVNVIEEAIALSGWAIFNQARDGGETAPLPGTATTVPELIGGKLNLVNTHGVEQSGIRGSGMTGFTIMHLDDAVSGDFTIRARVRMYDVVAPNTARGVIMGAFGVPAGGDLGDSDTPVAVMFNRGSGTIVRSFWTKDPGGNGVGAPTIDPSISEYIYEVSRDADGYVFSVFGSQDGELIESSTVPHDHTTSADHDAGMDVALRNGEPVYLGFAAGGASMEISNIKITVDGAVLLETEDVDGSPVPVEQILLEGKLVNADDTNQYQNSLANAQADNIYLLATVLPDVSDIPTVTWDSTQPSVATVAAVNSEDADYLDALIAVGLLPEGTTEVPEEFEQPANQHLAKVSVDTAGTVTIRAITVDGSLIATYNMFIYEGAQAVSSITIEGPAKVMVGNDIFAYLEADVVPSFATNQVLDWTSDNEAVATVDANGAVTGVAAGTATITAAATDGSGVTGTWDIEVLAGGNQIHWNFSDLPDGYVHHNDNNVVTPADFENGLTLVGEVRVRTGGASVSGTDYEGTSFFTADYLDTGGSGPFVEVTAQGPFTVQLYGRNSGSGVRRFMVMDPDNENEELLRVLADVDVNKGHVIVSYLYEGTDEKTLVLEGGGGGLRVHDITVTTN
ncbi:Ig-like domain-containing protein [Spirochaeta dissipatitropha]